MKLIDNITEIFRKIRLNNLVKKEATLLRENATSEEKSRLNFNFFNPTMVDSCIYGQMTGHCDNLRANELIEKSCPRVFNNDKNGSLNEDDIRLNGSPINRSRHSYWSPIEIYVYKNRHGVNVQNNKYLINYIKGDTDKLKFL